MNTTAKTGGSSDSAIVIQDSDDGHDTDEDEKPLEYDSFVGKTEKHLHKHGYANNDISGYAKTMAVFTWYKDYADKFRTIFNQWYRIETYVRHEWNEDMGRPPPSLPSPENERPGNGLSWVLEIQCSGTWIRQVSIAPSSYKQGGFGLFAERDFKAGEMIGYYIGNTIQLNEEKTSQPPSSWVTAPSQFCVAVRRVDEFWDLREARTMNATQMTAQLPPLYMMMHYMNDAQFPFREDSNEFKKATQLNNVVIEEDGTCRCTQPVERGDELLCAYLDVKGHQEWCKAKADEGTDSMTLE